jgi:outer membrane lipoprotein-sorting protein
VNYKSKGHKVEYVGTEELEGTPCYKLKITTKDGKEENWFIDKSNDYLIRSVTKAKIDGKDVENVVNFSNYQKQASGIIYPMTLGTDNGEINLSQIEINVPVDAKTFTPES